MNRFLKFVSDFSAKRYELTLKKLAEEKIPCAIFVPTATIDQKNSMISQLQQSGINLTTLFTIDKEDLENPPQVFQTIQFPLSSFSHLKNEIKFVFLARNIVSFVAQQRFLELGIEPIIFDDGNFPRAQFNFYMSHIEDVFRIYKDVVDDESRRELMGYMLQLISRRVSFCKFAPQSQYLLNGFLPQAGDIMIDGGACDGATAEMFTQLGCKVYAFEMETNFFNDTKKLANERGFVVENLGLADSPREVGYKTLGSASSLYLNAIAPDGSPKAQLTTIDLYVREKKLPSVDFIKLDTEGAELAILKGSVDTITRFKPKMALSAYHKPEDIWTLVDFIRSIRSDYEFAFRHSETTVDNAPFLFYKNQYLFDFCKRFCLPMRYSSGHELVLFAR